MPRGKSKKRSHRAAPAKRACKYGKRTHGRCPRGTPSQRRKARHAAMPHRVGKCPEHIWLEVEKDGCVTVGQAYRESDGKLRGPACNGCPDEYGGDEACTEAMLKVPKGCPHPRVTQREV